MLRCDLELKLLQHFGCHVFKLCTKFERNRIGWVIDVWRAFPVAAAIVSNMLPPAIICHCRLSSVHWRRNCFADHRITHASLLLLANNAPCSAVSLR